MKVSWDESKCIHSAKCVNSLPSVFGAKDGKLVITEDGAPEADIRRVVGECPSQALHIDE